MSRSGVEKLIWVLVYGGLLAVCLALFVTPRSAGLGWTLGVAGMAAAAVGVVLIYVRSRM